jgi:hypothetical protein
LIRRRDVDLSWGVCGFASPTPLPLVMLLPQVPE